MWTVSWITKVFRFEVFKSKKRFCFILKKFNFLNEWMYMNFVLHFFFVSSWDWNWNYRLQNWRGGLERGQPGLGLILYKLATHWLGFIMSSISGQEQVSRLVCDISELREWFWALQAKLGALSAINRRGQSTPNTLNNDYYQVRIVRGTPSTPD